MKKILSFVMALCLICTLLPATALTASAADTEIVFNLGTNGSAAHKDGSSNKTSYSETNGSYTLSLTGGTNMYPSSIDAKGNGCIKLGSSSKTGGFSFTVPADVTSVVIAVGKYKANTTVVTINGTTHTLTKSSNDGAYDAIEVDTSSTKTVTLTTTSSGKRAMVNSITYVIETGDADCTHTNTTVLPAEAPSCTEDGLREGWVCTDCGYSEQEEDPATGHDYEETVEEATCTEPGLKAEICSVCGDTVETVIPAGHNYVGGACSVCGAEAPIMFTLGADGAASHSDTTASKTDYTETVNGYTLNITNGTKMYPGSRDAKGNGCIKLGTGSDAGSFQFTVPADVTSVVIAIAGYKANSATVTINGTATALTETSNNGEYRMIPVDTSTNKTVSLSITSGNRAMVNSIEFVVAKNEPVAAIGDVEYTTLEDAIADAADGDVITLLTDVEIEELDLGDAILDLAGYTLTAEAIIANVQDTAAEKGLIKIEDPDYAVLSLADNTQLILWDNTTGATGFRVFDLQFAEAGMNLNNDDTDLAKSFWSDLDFADSRAYQMVSSTVSGLNVGFKLEWNGTEKTFWFGEEAQATILKDWGDKKYGNTNTELDYFFYVTVTGFVALQEDGVLNVTPVVQDYCGNVIEAGAIEYEFVAG